MNHKIPAHRMCPLVSLVQVLPVCGTAIMHLSIYIAVVVGGNVIGSMIRQMVLKRGRVYTVS